MKKVPELPVMGHRMVMFLSKLVVCRRKPMVRDGPSVHSNTHEAHPQELAMAMHTSWAVKNKPKRTCRVLVWCRQLCIPTSNKCVSPQRARGGVGHIPFLNVQLSVCGDLGVGVIVGEAHSAVELFDHLARKNNRALQVTQEGKADECRTPNDHGATGILAGSPPDSPECKEVWGSLQLATPTRLDVVERPYGLNHEGLHVTTASYHLEDNVGECPSMRVVFWYYLEKLTKDRGPRLSGSDVSKIERESLGAGAVGKPLGCSPTRNLFLILVPIGTHGISNMTNEIKLRPFNVPSGVAKLCEPRISSRRDPHACLLIARMGVSTFLGDRRRTRVRMSRYYLFATRMYRVCELPGSRGNGFQLVAKAYGLAKPRVSDSGAHESRKSGPNDSTSPRRINGPQDSRETDRAPRRLSNVVSCIPTPVIPWLDATKGNSEVFFVVMPQDRSVDLVDSTINSNMGFVGSSFVIVLRL
ncbi:hypothetical protein CRG98_036291 [Punica granatum]|uniref:Uncharacterized protein n=1 Tax=Punica granatum TaxID=22663 RepID=A0A2I0IH24_PUNGR|nr:hypothetical protein CRG98_036291 [Punica granatum]